MLGIIMCPSLKRYPEAPKDQPGCEVINCPHCGLKAWVSEKKRILMAGLKHFEVYCYDCLEDKARTDKEFFKNHLKVDI